MSRKEQKYKIKNLKEELKAANKANDFRLVKLTLLMIVLAVIAAFVYGRIQL